MYGRGACDTKGSVAAMFTALCELAASPSRPQPTQIVFAGLVDEEHAQAGSRALAATGFQADLAIIGEPTRLQVVTAHKGSLWLQLETRVQAARLDLNTADFDDDDDEDDLIEVEEDEDGNEYVWVEVDDDDDDEDAEYDS